MSKASFVLTGALAMAGWIGVAGTMLVVPATAQAQQKVSQKVGVPLKAAQDNISKKKWDAALGKIKEADAAPGKTAFDQYKINEMLWYVYLQQGRNADAARVLEGQIASGQMPASEKVTRTKTLAQLYARAGSYGKAAATAQQYLKSVPGDKDMQLLVANAYYQQKDYKGAIAAADRVLKGGGTPSQDLLQLVLRSNYELGDSAGTAKALDQLLKYYPSTDTWERVLDGYLKTTKHDHALMALYRLAEDVGALQDGTAVHRHDAGPDHRGFRPGSRARDAEGHRRQPVCGRRGDACQAHASTRPSARLMPSARPCRRRRARLLRPRPATRW